MILKNYLTQQKNSSKIRIGYLYQINKTRKNK